MDNKVKKIAETRSIGHRLSLVHQRGGCSVENIVAVNDSMAEDPIRRRLHTLGFFMSV